MQAQILLVEDNTILCEVLERNLRARDHAVTVVQDVAGALAALHTGTYHLILLDINLPDSTGWDLLRAIHDSPEIALPRTAEGRLPVVVLSAVRVSNRRLEEFRPLAYLAKPFPLEAVLRLAAQAAERLKENTESYSGTDL
ncbi:MAG TPA: response regulator [Ktedonobacteraceae bacterium]|nr:response regulator [Ktedonobacteraceae bacterium]